MTCLCSCTTQYLPLCWTRKNKGKKGDADGNILMCFNQLNALSTTAIICFCIFDLLLDKAAQTCPYNSTTDSLYIHPPTQQTIYHAGKASINFCYFFLVNITATENIYLFVLVMKKGVNGCLKQISFNLCNFTLHKVFWHETME